MRYSFDEYRIQNVEFRSIKLHYSKFDILYSILTKYFFQYFVRAHYAETFYMQSVVV